MSNNLIRAWEFLSRPDQDIQAFQEFLPAIYRYTNSTNLWKNAPKNQLILPNSEQTVVTLLGSEIGKRSLRKTLLAIDRQGGPCLPLTREWASNGSADQYKMMLIPPQTMAFPTQEGLLNDIVYAVDKLAPNERIILRGNCWGMTESILFTAKYPDKVAGLVLGLPFLARKKDSLWLYDNQGGMAQRYPDQFQNLISIAQSNQEKDMLSNLFNQLNSSEYSVSSQAYQALCRWDYTCLTGLEPNEQDDLPATPESITLKQIQIRFQRDNFDLPDDGIVPLLRMIPDTIPIIVVGQKLDPLNNPDSLPLLRENLPQAEFVIQDADWHWMPQKKEGKSNYFLQQAYAYAMGRMGLIVNKKLNVNPSYTLLPKIEEATCPV
jgi:pimeloyl-ACP methyl ester carboxylesterase